MAAPVAPQPEVAMAAPMQAPVEAAPVAPVTMAAAPMVAPEAPSALMAFASKDSLAPMPKPAPRKAKAPVRKPTTVASLGKSSAVVQLGAYSSPERVTAAWEKLKVRYPALAELSPMRARFDGPKGTVYRLSVKGFASQREAMARCDTLRSRGGNCFVRTVAGDAPVQMASR
jgi:cell division septation protein DedD